MRKVETSLNNQEYKDFCERAVKRGLTPYGLAKLLVLVEISTGEYECSICKKQIPASQVVVHHITYHPEVTILICRHCHAWLHSEDTSRGVKRAWALKRQGKQARKSM